MTRLKNRDDLADMKGRLGSEFRSVTLTALHVEFFAVPNIDEKNAATVLHHFYAVASKLSNSENEFNKRARPASGKPSLMTHLRGTAQMTTLREFTAAKNALLDLNADIGRHIIRLVEKEINPTARKQARVSQPTTPV